MVSRPRPRPGRTVGTEDQPTFRQPTLVAESDEVFAAGSADETGSDLVAAGSPSTGSTFTMSYGKRIVKAFPITESELNEVAAAKRIAAVCFTIAGALFGFAMNLNKDMQFANSLPEKVTSFWNAIWYACLIGSGITSLLGIWLWLRGHNRLAEIKREARFD